MNPPERVLAGPIVEHWFVGDNCAGVGDDERGGGHGVGDRAVRDCEGSVAAGPSSVVLAGGLVAESDSAVIVGAVVAATDDYL